MVTGKVLGSIGEVGMLFNAETQRSQRKRRAHATTASWWNGLGNLAE
jgi:hypothetical protein